MARSQANSQALSAMQQSLKDTTEAFIDALRYEFSLAVPSRAAPSPPTAPLPAFMRLLRVPCLTIFGMHIHGRYATARQEPSAEAVCEMREEHARQLQAVVDAFKQSLATVAQSTERFTGGGGGGVDSEASRQQQHRPRPSPHRPSHPSSPLIAGTPRSSASGGGGGSAKAARQLSVLIPGRHGSRHDSSSSPVDTDYTADFEDINDQVVALRAARCLPPRANTRKHVRANAQAAWDDVRCRLPFVCLLFADGGGMPDARASGGRRGKHPVLQQRLRGQCGSLPQVGDQPASLFWSHTPTRVPHLKA